VCFIFIFSVCVFIGLKPLTIFISFSFETNVKTLFDLFHKDLNGSLIIARHRGKILYLLVFGNRSQSPVFAEKYQKLKACAQLSGAITASTQIKNRFVAFTVSLNKTRFISERAINKTINCTSK
jgi:hypothetical protein